ncbi:MAG: DUF3604 domain-containing protein [Myxococcota bacterium]|nr:DUF3604 domain-containing protein [Myxococcota bacterium]
MLLALLTACGGCSSGPDSGLSSDPTAREACTDKQPLRQLLWGDLHVHTALSFDAWVYDVRLQPDDAYAFARGETVYLPPLDGQGQGTTAVALSRPLDFAAVTDHAEYFGEVYACVTEGVPGYDSDICQGYRESDAASIQAFGVRLAAQDPERFEGLCSDAGCGELSDSIWSDVQRAAESAYDRTAGCEFTSFVGYEWSGATNVVNLHRNVLFANAIVPSAPLSYFEEATPEGLWSWMSASCIDAGTGCDVLAIPHNGNLSNGNLFPDDLDAETAEVRAKLEPLVEVYQHKGSSECLTATAGLLGAPDELCAFEEYGRQAATPCEDDGTGTGAGGMSGLGCVSARDTLRGTLIAGMAAEQRTGINPYRLGVIASTDTHSGTPGAVAEDDYLGHLGSLELTVEGRLAEPGLNPAGFLDSPGGLTAVWAEDNSRASIFAALRRREVYATSGPRISLRMFAGRDLPDGLCDDPDMVAAADAAGVPMGSLLADGTGAPSILVSALADPEGVPLQRIQIVKGSIDASGAPLVEVFDVAGGDNGASVDLSDCTPLTAGSAALCAQWTDPTYSAGEPAYYYARVVEDPTCRWSWRDCLTLPEAERPDTCFDEAIPQTIQERAWGSPVWAE